MTKTIEAKAVREARAEARRMARRTDLSYQQALDRIARDAGAEHWAAFAAMHPSKTVPEDGGEAEKTAGPAKGPERETLSGYLRSMVTGEDGAMEDRIRSALVVNSASDFIADLPVDADGSIEVDPNRVRRNLWLSTARNIATAPFIILSIGCVYALGNLVMPDVTGISLGDVIRTAAYAFVPPIVVFLACLAIGDQPGMERRRAAAWTAMLWIQIIGVAVFLLGGFDAFDRLLERTTGMGPDTALVFGMGSVVAGGTLRESIHALMALGAALGPKGDGSSIADQDALSYAIEQKRIEERSAAAARPRPEPLTPEMARTMGMPKPWWRRIDPITVLIAYVGTGCLFSFAGVGLRFFLHIESMPLAYAGLAMLAPVMLAVVAGIIALIVHSAIGLPGMMRRRMRTHRLVRSHERARRA